MIKKSPRCVEFTYLIHILEYFYIQKEIVYKNNVKYDKIIFGDKNAHCTQ